MQQQAEAPSETPRRDRPFDGCRVPLLRPALAFAAGCSTVGGEEPFAVAARAVALALAAFIAGAALIHPLAGRRGLLAAFAGVGFGVASAAADAVPAAPSDFDGATLVKGRIVSDPERGAESVRFDVAARELRRAGRDVRWTGTVRLTVRGSAPFAVHRGDDIEAWTDLRSPRPRRNPGGFDEVSWARREGVAALATCKSARLIRLASAGDGRPLNARLRDAARSAFDRLPAGPRRAVAISMILGDTGELSPDLESDFRSSGLLHVLVVSGAQVALLVVLLRAVLPMSYRFRWRGWIVEAAILVLYSIVSGGQNSVVRATVMALAIGAAARLDLRGAGMNGLSLAALIVFTARPLDVLDPGAQLSFGVAAGLIRFAPGAVERLRAARLPGAAAEVLGSAAVATAAATPLVWTRFDSFPMAALPANIVAAPLAAGLLFATTAFLAAIALGIDALAAPVVLGLSGAMIEVAKAASAADLEWRTPGPSLVSWAVLAAVAVQLGSRGSVRAGGLGAAWLLAALAGSGSAPGDGRAHFFFLDVGQGDATLVVTPNGRAILVDAGPAFGVHDAGRTIVTPAAWAVGLRRLDVLALTHPHADHDGGARAVARLLGPREVWLGPRHDRPAPVVSLSIRAGATRTIDGLGVGVLWPDAATALRATDANARSLVLIVRYGAVDALLLGDAPLGVQRRIEPGRASAMRRTIVKAAHHGSATAGFAPWAADRAPDFAVVSVGRGNRFGHPSPVVLDRWRRVGALVHRTDVAGALHVATDGARVWSAAVGDPALRIRR